MTTYVVRGINHFGDVIEYTCNTEPEAIRYAKEQAKISAIREWTVYRRIGVARMLNTVTYREQS